MSGILILKDLNKGSTLKQGDKTELEYQLADGDGDTLNLNGKTATVRLVSPDFTTIGYEKTGVSVGQDNIVRFTIDRVIQARKYYVEIIVDNKYVFPSVEDGRILNVDKSSLGQEANIIEIVGVDAVVAKVMEQVQGDIDEAIDGANTDISQVITDANTALTTLNQTNTTLTQAEEAREQAEAERKRWFEDTAIGMENLVVNGDFRNGLTGWSHATSQSSLSVEGGNMKVNYVTEVGNLMINYNTNPIDYKENHVYYSIARFNPLGLTGEARLRHNAGEYTARQPLIQNEFQTISTLFEGSAGGYITEFRMFANNSKAGDYFYLDYYIVLDLTDIFGKGNEPTAQEMDELIKLTGYFEGTIMLTQKLVLNWLLNLIRKNKEAIVFMGGGLD